MSRRLFRVKQESALFQTSREVVADTARQAAYAVGFNIEDLSVARGTVETADRVVFKSPFTPRITVELVDTQGGTFTGVAGY